MPEKKDLIHSAAGESLDPRENEFCSSGETSELSRTVVSGQDSEFKQDKTPNETDGASPEGIELREAQVTELYRQGIPGIVSALIGAAILTAALWPSASHTHLIIWFSGFSISLIPRFLLGKAFLRTAPRGEAIMPWATKFALGTASGGLFWGALPIFLFPANNPLHQALLTFVLGGLCVGIAVANGARREAHVPFIVIVSAALVGRFFYEGGRDYLIMGFLWIVFTAYLLGAARRMHETITESLRLRFEKDRYIGFLGKEKARAEDLATELLLEVDERRLAEQALKEAHDELEGRVEERTADLVAVNEQLKREIASRMEAEIALRKSEERYRIHFENANDVIYSYDSELKLTEVSPSIERLLGYSPSELVGKPIFEFDIIPYEDMSKAADDARRVLCGERIDSTIYRFKAKDGTELVGEVSGAPIVQVFDASGNGNR